MRKPLLDDDLLQPHEVARVFGVHPKTISRWAVKGKLPYRVTLGGHRRYRVGDVRALLRKEHRGRGCVR